MQIFMQILMQILMQIFIYADINADIYADICADPVLSPRSWISEHQSPRAAVRRAVGWARSCAARVFLLLVPFHILRSLFRLRHPSDVSRERERNPKRPETEFLLLVRWC